MYIIRQYADTYIELNIIKARLDALNFRKEVLYEKYFSTTSKLTDTKNTGNEKKDKYADYVHELTKKDKKTGKSLDEEIEETRNLKNKYKYYLKRMKYELKQLKGIEYDLFNCIVFDGEYISRAVEKTAEKHNKDVGTIWKNYYHRIEKHIKIFRKKRRA